MCRGVLELLLASTDLMGPTYFEISVQNSVDIIRFNNVMEIKYIQKACLTRDCSLIVTAVLAWILHNQKEMKNPSLCANNIYEIWKDQHLKCMSCDSVVKTLVNQIGVCDSESKK